jgi:UDP-N-acetylglucosamine 4,6-dehydratase/5-epimerase
MARILITGGTGFLGKRLGKALQEFGHLVVLTGRNNKQNLLAAKYSGCEALAMDVSHIEAVRDIVAQTRPEVIIHAAATKFVDVSERQPMETIDVNVVGSQNVARVAIEKGVQLVLGISTDKASPPVRNIYGMSKAMMERLFCGMDGKTSTSFLCVRYGNVAWSTGSVLPIWHRMHQEKGVLGTTGPEMYRFFFTVDEAVQLVLTALNQADELKGKVLSRKMKAARIEEILRVWTDIYGGRYEKISGRPGERLEEYLFGELELPFTTETSYDGITHYVISFNNKSENPVRQVLSSTNTEQLSRDEIAALLKNIPFEEL